jgi:hypothetical protein
MRGDAGSSPIPASGPDGRAVIACPAAHSHRRSPTHPHDFADPLTSEPEVVQGPDGRGTVSDEPPPLGARRGLPGVAPGSESCPRCPTVTRTAPAPRSAKLPRSGFGSFGSLGRGHLVTCGGRPVGWAAPPPPYVSAHAPRSSAGTHGGVVVGHGTHLACRADNGHS